MLRYGEQSINSIRAKQKQWNKGVGFQEHEVFEAFLTLPAPQRKIVREVVLLFAQVMAKRDES